MKIAANTLTLAAAGLGLALGLLPAMAFAQAELDNLPVLPGETPAIAVPDMPTASIAAAATPATSSAENISNDAAKKIDEQIKLIQSRTGDLSLEDMNKARATLARLDLLVELEDKMGELQEARQKRQKASFSDDMIPSSTLMPPRGAVASLDAEPQEMPRRRRISYDVSQITGVNGDYTAVLSTGDDSTTTVRVGDELEDDSKVIRINAQGVTLFSPKTKDEKFLRLNMVAGEAPVADIAP